MKINVYYTVKDWHPQELIGYEPMTTVFADFSVAEIFGKEEIQNTYDRVMKEFRNNYKYLTELVMALNWKIFQHYEENESFAELYDRLWREADGYAMDNLKGEELTYFLDTTD